MSKLVAGLTDQHSATPYLARVVGVDGIPVTQASLSEISFEVYNITEPSFPVQVINQTTLDIMDVISDTLIPNSQDSRWPYLDADDPGYNFNFDLPSAALPKAGYYRVDVKFTPTVGDFFWAKFELQARITYHDGP